MANRLSFPGPPPTQTSFMNGPLLREKNASLRNKISPCRRLGCTAYAYFYEFLVFVTHALMEIVYHILNLIILSNLRFQTRLRWGMRAVKKATNSNSKNKIKTRESKI